MFEKITPEQVKETEKVAKQPVVAPETPKVENEQQLSTMDMDETILRCFVLYSEYIGGSTKGPCLYVYVKPGSRRFSSNIDFVQAIYELNGIKMNKHVSHLGNHETEVLYISSKSYCEDLDDAQKEFFKRTAPEVNNLSDLYDVRYLSKKIEKIVERAEDVYLKLGIESGQINPKTYQGPIRLPYKTNTSR